MGIRLSKSDIAFIKQLPVCRLATSTEECEPVVRPVWPVFDGANIYIASDPDTPKLEHIEANPQVSLVFDDYDPKNWSTIKGIRVQGEAELLWNGKEYRYAHDLLKKITLNTQSRRHLEEGDVPIIAVTWYLSLSKWSSGQWKK
jgi:nitroimidazol reductase NimA-like FMN-containing flavoprotein (pyridoxamine 5'-phosphate oxidase superfamily)